MGETFDLFVGSHNGYTRLPSPVVHRRWVFSLRNGFFLVRDLVQGSGKHRLDIAWHLSPELQFRTAGVFGVKGTSSGLSIVCADKHGWAEDLRKYFWSPVYGKKEPATVLNFGTVADLPAEFVTLLVPLDEVIGIPGNLMQLDAKPATTATVKAYLYRTPSEECSFFFSETGREWSHGTLASDAEFVCWQRKREGGEQLLILRNGSHAQIEGNAIYRCQRKIERCEVVICDGRKAVRSSDSEPLLDV